jgi:pimeloyl-ACP methyl ester carboxylesterase
MLPRGRGDGNPTRARGRRLGTERAGEKPPHPRLVLRARRLVESHVAGAGYLPELLRGLGAREEALGLGARGVAIDCPGDHQHRCPDAVDPVDRAERVGGQAEARPELHGQEGRQRQAELAEAQREAVVDSRAHGESGGERITFGYLESLDARAILGFVRRQMPGERVGAIGVSLGGASLLLGPQPLSVGAVVLEAVYPTLAEAIEEEHGVAGGVKKARALDHVEAAPADPVEQEHHTGPAPARHEPAAQRAGGRAEEAHGTPRQITGEVTARARRGRRQRSRRPVAGARAREQKQRGEDEETSDYFTSPA